MNILDSIVAKAQEGAHQGTAEANAPTIPFDGTAKAPSAGFHLLTEELPATKTPMQHQLAAVETILDHKRVILALQPGMGKTLVMQIVAASLAIKGQKSIIVVPPALRQSPWLESFVVDFPQLKVELVEGTKPKPISPAADVVIVGDSVIAKRQADLLAWGATALFADEAHRFKSRTAQRSKALQAIADTVEYVVPATGTLSVNHAGDVYQPLRITGERQAKAVSGGASWTRFMDEWCETEMVWTGKTHVKVVKGCRDAEGLRQRLVTTCMVSVPRDEVIDLPDRTFAVNNLTLNGSAAEYRRIEKDFMNWVREVHGDAGAKRASKAEAIVKMGKLWEHDGLAKVAAVTEHVEALVAQGEQVVLFAWHTSVIAKLVEAVSALKVDGRSPSVSRIVGGMSSEQKGAEVNAFQAGQVDVIVCQVEAGGVGITLHASANTIFAQLPWSPASFAQACDRTYRIGQTRKVTVAIDNGVGMFSQRLWDVLQAKAEITDAINTGKPSTIDQSSVVEAVLESYGW